ncbi:hypothetical protein ABEB36_004608 [Hypothenemus hampei]|uniref:Uncharacterized protein n=1 Tax=Hypothenemus hampei TaxID=57062 RepID=A0ABD1F474_HYPHA
MVTVSIGEGDASDTIPPGLQPRLYRDSFGSVPLQSRLHGPLLDYTVNSENSDNESDNLNRTLTPNQEQIISVIDNLNIENVLSRNMDNIRFHTSLLPTFSGKQEHLENRLKTFAQRIIAKSQCEVLDPTSKATLLIQLENTSVLILTANSPQILKTMLMIQRPTTLDDVVQCVVNYDMMESQVNFTNSNFPPTKNPIERINNFKSNQVRTPSNTFRNQSHPIALPPQNRPQTFPSQPIHIQSRPINRHYPTNDQVFSQPRPLVPNKRQDSPTLMSTSTARPFRLEQQKQPSLRYQNHFVPTGPRNFVSQELTNVEVHPQSTIEPDQTLEENDPNDYSSYYMDDSKDPYDYNQEFNFPQNLEAKEENFENFPKTASCPELI